MAYGRKWKPSKTAAREFAKKMDEIDDYCSTNGIIRSLDGDSYYFSINGKEYRVSNHSIEASNRHAYSWNGEQIHRLYHSNERSKDVVYIHAGKLRIIEIYEKLKAGKSLNGFGNEVAT